ncbi:unnamed protein product [Linum tenue]|uniref:Protein kinase domain-containing protein n=1 Tax=Linum tenue TaxID=586396 RepID=A0AAV0LAH6_9ROSI|nr:unnamed protein product [Linum tenue]
MCQVGHATYSRKVPIWVQDSGKLADLTSHFTFNIDPQGRSTYGAGFAFFLAPPDFHIPPNSAGGFLGLYNLTTSNSARNQILHVEFDTFPNPEWDPPFQHGEFLLVYEFMPNGSLDSHLFGRKPSLSWPVRHRISLGLASALLYLHEEGDQCVIHRDIKSSNIMLDSGFNVKLGDFGLARLMDHELGLQTTGLAGTLGYLAPEYVITGRASKESDVYSFGVVAMEITTGRKGVDPVSKKSRLSLVEWVWELYGDGNLMMGVDERLQMDVDDVQIQTLMVVGLWCSHPNHSARPSIRQVIQVLNSEAPLPNLPGKMPVPLYEAGTPQSVSSSDVLVSNTMTSSIQDGR